MNIDALWKEMLAEFRALDGVADNVRLDHGPFGRGLFPVDAKRPVRISIPKELLVSIQDVSVVNGVVRVSERAPIGERGRAFIEQYEQNFSWGPGHGETELFLQMMNDLPEHLKAFLMTELGLGRFFRPISPAVIQDWFFASRIIRADGRRVIMPIIELANHGGTVQYDRTKGVSLAGVFENEVLVCYAKPTDPYDLFIHWMFAPIELMAFSLPIHGTFGGQQFEIRRGFDDAPMPPLPKIVVEGDRIIANYLLFGHQQFPGLPKALFRRAMGSLQLKDVDETYDFIQMMNRNKFLDLLTALDGIDQPASVMLRRLACNQLRALSYHFGTREA